MEILSELFRGIRDLIPTVLAVIGIIIFILISRYLIKKQSSKIASYQFRRQLITFILTLVGVLIIILVLPVNDALRGQLLSLLGILLTAAIALSATTFMGNIMAGLMLRAIGGFRPGDFISVADHFGRVTELGLFHVEIQTEFRDLTTMPNLYLVTNPVKVIRSSGTVITAEASLGYDVSHNKIEKALLKAAEESGLKESFVHVVNLGDYSVTYRVAGLLEDVKQLLTARSTLREMMLDKLHGADIEIVSPTFMNTRAHQPDKKFIPIPDKPSETIKRKTFTPPEKLVFDKADSAESLVKLKDRYQKYDEELKEVKEKIKAHEYSEDDPEIVRYLDDLAKYLEDLANRISKLETENKKED